MADILTITIRCVYIPLVWWQLFWPEQYMTWTLKSFAVLSLTNSMDRISKCIIVTIVLDRVVAVVWPLRYKDICTTMRSTVAMVVIYVTILSTTIPISVDAFMYKFKTGINSTGLPTAYTESSEYVKQSVLPSTLKTVNLMATRFLFDLTPIIVVIIGNIVIIVGLRRSASSKSTSEDSQRQRKHQDRQLTKLLLTVSFLFLILCVPFDLLSIVTINVGSAEVGDRDFFRHVVIEVFRTLTLLNSSVNFVVYAVMNKRYREGYKSLLTC